LRAAIKSLNSFSVFIAFGSSLERANDYLRLSVIVDGIIHQEAAKHLAAKPGSQRTRDPVDFALSDV
jgi:hypothetical protein